MVEQGLSSAYTSFYEVIRITTPIPWLRGRPVSVTDWLFVFYVAGVAAALARYLVSYLRLRRLLRQGMPGGEEIVEQVWARGIVSRYFLWWFYPGCHPRWFAGCFVLCWFFRRGRGLTTM